MYQFTKMRALSIGLVFAVVPLASVAVTVGDGADNTATSEQQILTSKNGVYIVRLAGNPAAAYEGNIKGLKATKPRNGKKLNPNSKAVIDYADYLTDQHDNLLNKVGGGKKLYSYKFAYNGFAAQLNASQVSVLRKMADVVSVTPDTLLQRDTITTHEMLNLDAGIWNELRGADNAGEGIIVGIVDSGIWPESASFSDRTGSNPNGKPGKLGFQQIPGWHGKCTPGQEFPASDCNQKLIGAQWYSSGFGGDAAVTAAYPYEYASARDAAGHGSHTASTAAGNDGVPVVIAGKTVGEASGMAPQARIAAYKVCWGKDNEGGCFGSDSVAAIDQAVIDGVDVLNFSISGSRSSSLDQVEVAFLFAADAGVFVAASAGNSGPGASTVAHNTPWLTTVAAGTHDRGYEATIEIEGDGTIYNGVSLGEGVGPNEMVYSEDVVADGADPLHARLCVPNGSLDPIQVNGKIVLCDRGAIARTDKSLAVLEAGGVGMVLANTSPSSVNADFHSVPSIHVDVPTGDTLRAYAQTNATGTISEGTEIVAEASQVAGFSSRGPALAGSGDLLKPDIMAPGVDVIAAVSPPGNGGEDYAAYSGTSMSSPHMAGLGALMKQRHPGWSPMAIKSAFMTTATQSTLPPDDNPIAGTPFGYGAGFVQPNRATDPGLVYDAGFLDWLGYLCGTGELAGAPFCGALGIDPSDLNYPSIAIGAFVGSQTVTRTVTNVGSASTYQATVNGLPGIVVSVVPEMLTLAPGESAAYDVIFTNTGAPVGSYVFGDITWSDGEHVVRSPVALNPLSLLAPAEITGSGEAGESSFDITFGYTGAYAASSHGLEPATFTMDNVLQDEDQTFNPADPLGDPTVGSVNAHTFDLSGAALFRVAMPPGAVEDVNTDLDIFVVDPNGVLVASSTNGGSVEQVDIPFPMDGEWTVYVHGWFAVGGDADYDMYSWAISLTPGGNLNIDSAPVAATGGTTAAVDISWTGATVGQWHLGAIGHIGEGGELIGATVVDVDNRE